MLKARFWKYPDIPFFQNRDRQMNGQKRLLAITALLFGLVVGCGGSDAIAEVRDDIYLRFTIDGDGFSNKSFEPDFATDTRARNVNYWMASKRAEQTTFHMDTTLGDLQLDINFKVQAESLGSYSFEPDKLNMNQNFELNLRNPEWEERKQYYAQQATLELTDHDGEYISGTFSGRFFRGSLSNQDDRSYVTISDGAFRVNWAEGQRSKNKDKW
jgi:hypothetical protein